MSPAGGSVIGAVGSRVGVGVAVGVGDHAGLLSDPWIIRQLPDVAAVRIHDVDVVIAVASC